MVDVDKVLQELNKNTENWVWWNPGDMICLGSCFKYSKYINCHILKEDKTIEDVIESWKTEKLRVECKAAIFILGRVLIYEKYGSEYCNANRDIFDYINAANNRDAMYSLPFNNDLKPVEGDNLSNALFQGDKGVKLDYRYIKGTIMHNMRESQFPLLESAYQGENTFLYDPKLELYIAFLRDVDEDLTKAKYKVVSLNYLESQLITNARNDFNKKYPDTLYDVEKLTKLNPSQKFTRTILSYDQVYEFKNGKYEEK